MPETIEVGVIRVPMVVDQAPIEAQLRALEVSANRAGKTSADAFRAGAAEMQRFGQQTSVAREGVQGLVYILGAQAVGAMRGFWGWIGRTTAGLVDLASLGVLHVARSMDRMAEATRDANGELSTMGKVGKVASSGLEVAAKAAIVLSSIRTGIPILTTIAAAKVSFDALKSADGAARAFIPSWNRVRTLLQGTPEDVEMVRNEVIGLASDLGVNFVDAADAFYEVLSAMPDLAGQSAGALDVLRAALTASATGFTDATTAVHAITGVLYNFGLSADHAMEVSDALFQAQNLGALTFGEIASSVSKAAPLVASLGGSYQDLFAITALLTNGQTSTTEAMTMVVSALGNVIAQSSQAKAASRELGVEFDATAIKTKGLAHFLLDIIDATRGNPEILRKFFGDREAVTLLIALSQRTNDLRGYVKDIGGNSAETRRQLGVMNEEISRQRDLLKGPWRAALLQAGLDLESLNLKALKAANSVQKAVSAAFSVPLADRLMGKSAEQSKFEEEWFRAHRFDFGATMPEYVPTVRTETLAPVVVSSTRPYPEPRTIDYSSQKIQDYQAQLKAAAILEYDRTRNMEAFEAATRKAQESVNKLVLSEVARLRAGHVEEKSLNELMASYQVSAPSTKLAEERKRLLDEASSLRKDLSEKLAGLTSGATDAARRALDQFEAELRQKVAKVGETLSAADEEALQRLHAAVDASGDLERFRSELQSISEQTPSQNQVATLDSFIGRVQEYVAANGSANGTLAEGTELREQINRLLQDAIHLYGESSQAVHDEAKEIVDAEQRKREELLRTAEERTRRLQDQARAIEENVRAGLQLAEAFKLIDSNAAQALEGVGQLAGAILRMSSGNPVAITQAIPVAIGAVASIFSALRNRGEEQAAQQLEAQRALLAQLQRNQEALDQNTKAIAGGKTAGQITTGQAGTLGLEDTLGKNIVAGAFDKRKIQALLDDRDSVARLKAIGDATGIDLVSAAQQAAQSKTMEGLLIFTSSLARAQDILAQSADHFGAIADSNIAGQMERFRQEVDLLDLDTPREQLEHFISTLKEIGAGGFAGRLEAMVEDGDLSGARKMVQDVFEQLVTGQLSAAQISQLFGSGVTPEDVRQILSDVNGWLEQMATGGGVVGGGAAQTRLSVSETEVQANQLLTVETSMLFRLTNIDTSAAALLSLLSGRAPSLPVLPSINPPSLQSLGMGGASGAVTTAMIDLRGVTFALSLPAGTPPPRDTDGWQRIGEGLGRGLAQQLQDMAQGAGIDRPRLTVRR